MRIGAVKYKRPFVQRVQKQARISFYYAGLILAHGRVPASHALKLLKGIRAQVVDTASVESYPFPN